MRQLPAVLCACLRMDSLIMDEIKKVLEEVRDLKRSHTNLDTKMDTLLVEVQAIKSDHKRLKEDVEVLQLQHCAMDETVSNLEVQVDRMNRAALSKNAVILGVPMVPDEDVKKLVHSIALAVKSDLPLEAVIEARRMLPKESGQPGSRSAPIKVVFSSETHKEELFAKKKLHGLLLSSVISNPEGSSNGGNRIIIRDELTSFGLKLLNQVRTVQEEAELKFVWPGRDGVILAKATNDAKVTSIRSTQDVLKLQRAHPKRQRDTSMLNSTSFSLSDEHDPKRHQK